MTGLNATVGDGGSEPPADPRGLLSVISAGRPETPESVSPGLRDSEDTVRLKGLSRCIRQRTGLLFFFKLKPTSFKLIRKIYSVFKNGQMI